MIDKKKYIDIGFVVLMFVLTTAFIKEYIFRSPTLISSSFAGLIGIGFSLIIYFALKRFGIIPKVIVLLTLLGFIAIYSQAEKSKIYLIQGVWITEDQGKTLKVEIIDKHLKMLLLPVEESRVFDYEINGNNIEIFDDEESEYFVWEIQKLNKNKLTILENKTTIINFKRE